MQSVILLAAMTTLPPRPEVVVQTFYRHVVAIEPKPLGIPEGKARKMLWPLMSRKLVHVLDDAIACERDYFRKHRNPNDKASFPWLEDNPFSGANEEAIPAEVAVVKTIEVAPRKFRVVVEFTYRDTFETYGRPPDPKAHFSWRGDVSVDCTTGPCLIDDFTNRDADANPSGEPLSRSFRSSCRGLKWIGQD